MTNTTTHSDYRVGTWKLDPTHSELSFTVRHLAISKVRGVFRDFDVTVVAPEDPAGLSVEATVEVASVDTNQQARDNHLRTSDFFLVEEHPTMTFRSTRIQNDGEQFTLNGELTLRGVTRSVLLRGEASELITDPWGAARLGVTASTTLNRRDFGVNWNQALEAGGFTLGDEVKVEVELQLVLQA